MKREHPILFSTEMVKAILEGRKTMTRRICKQILPNPQGEYPARWRYRYWAGSPFKSEHKENPERFYIVDGIGKTLDIKCPYGRVGDILWVKEKWKKNDLPIGWPYHYYAANDTFTDPDNEKWKPSVFMPRAASRITLEITDIKVERVQDISWRDAEKEGCSGYRPTQYEPTDEFKDLWIRINGEESWQTNPWVWVINFKKI